MTDLEYEQIGLLILKKYFKEKLRLNKTDEEIKNDYDLVLKRLISNAKKIDDIKIQGVNSINENGTSISFKDIEAFTLTKDILALLPTAPNVYSW